MVSLGPADIAVVVILLGVTVLKGAWVTWRANRADDCEADGFFMAGRSMAWWAVGLSTFASNIGAEHFVGQAGAAASSGIPVAIYEWSAGLLIFFLGFGLAPIYLRLDLTTMPQWFELRFNRWCRLVLALISIVAYIVTKIASTLFAGAVLLDVILGISMWTSVPVILVFTAIYAAAGGLRAVMYTDALQATIFLVGGAVGMAVSFSQIGGAAGLWRAVGRNEGEIGHFMSSLRSPSDADYPWTGMLIGQPMASIWYWCIDQTMVQRVLSARNVAHAQAGCSMAGYLKILPPFMMVFPGMIARVFYQECKRTGGREFPDWCGTSLDDGAEASKAYPLLIAKTFPDGVRGLMIVSMVLAMMSSLDSVFNCVSTIFTVDIYKRLLNPGASGAKQLWVGRLVTLVAGAVGLAWLPMIQGNADGLYLVTQSAMTHMSPTLVAVFLLGLFWPRCNGHGALAGLVVGFALGIARFIAAEVLDCSEGDVWSLTCMNFNHMALILFALAGGITVAVSLVTPAPALDRLRGTTWWATDEDLAMDDARGPDAKPPRRQGASPVVEQLVLVSGIVLLAIMLCLCVGWGYSDSPGVAAHSGLSIAGAAVGIYLGLLPVLCLLVAFRQQGQASEAASGTATKGRNGNVEEEEEQSVTRAAQLEESAEGATEQKKPPPPPPPMETPARIQFNGLVPQCGQGRAGGLVDLTATTAVPPTRYGCCWPVARYGT